MDNLPKEIVAQILDYLIQTSINIARYSSVSRIWQHAVEQTTFQSLTVFSLELDLFRSAYTAERRQYVRKLKFCPIALIEAHSHDPRLVEDVQQQTSRSVTRFFEVLRESKGRRALHNDGLSLRIDLPSIFRKKDIRFMNARPERLPVSTAGPSLLFPHQSLRGLTPIPLNLDRFRESLADVTCFEGEGGYGPAAVVEMVRAFPNLRKFTWVYGVPRKPRSREDRHFQLVSSLRSLKISQAETITFQSNNECVDLYTDVGQDLSGPDFNITQTAFKTFSSFSMLKSLKLRGDFDHNTFQLWSWPNLQECHINFSTFAPDGQRHFLHNPECHAEQEDDQEESDENETSSNSDSDFVSDRVAFSFSHHTLPNPATIPAMIASLISATANMPRLEILEFQNTEFAMTCFGWYFTMTYFGAGTATYVDDGPEDILQPRVYFETGTWRPWHAGEQGEVVMRTLAELGIGHKFVGQM